MRNFTLLQKHDNISPETSPGKKKPFWWISFFKEKCNVKFSEKILLTVLTFHDEFQETFSH